MDSMIIMEFMDSYMAFTWRYIVDCKQRRFMKGRIFSRIIEDIGKTDGRMAVTSTTFQLVGVLPVDLRIGKEMS